MSNIRNSRSPNSKISVIALNNSPELSGDLNYVISVLLDPIYANFNELAIGNNVLDPVGSLTTGSNNEIQIIRDDIGISTDLDEGIITLPLGSFRLNFSLNIYSTSISTSCYICLIKDGIVLDTCQNEGLTPFQGNILSMTSIVDSSISTFQYTIEFAFGVLAGATFIINSYNLTIEQL